MTHVNTDDKHQEINSLEQVSKANQVTDTTESTGSLNEISIIKFKMNKFKLAVMLAAKLTRNYTDGYLDAQREVMLTGLGLYGRLYDIGYVDRERYAKDVLDLVNTYERHLKEAPIIASIRQIRSMGKAPGVDLHLTEEERNRYIGKFSVADTMNKVILEAQDEVGYPRPAGRKLASPADPNRVPVKAVRAKPIVDSVIPSPPKERPEPRPNRLASQRARKTVLDKISGWLQ